MGEPSGARDGRFYKAPHPGSLVQAGRGLDGTKVVSGEHGRDVAISGTLVRSMASRARVLSEQIS